MSADLSTACCRSCESCGTPVRVHYSKQDGILCRFCLAMAMDS